MEAQFAQVNAARIAAKERTKERADAARNAMQIASDIAWMAFDAGKFEEAANWFAKSAELKEDNHVNARGYWEEDLRIHAAETEAKFDSQIKDAQAKLPAAEESKKATLRVLIDTLEKNRYTIRYNDISMLENVARENNDSASLLKYAEQELEIRRLELAYLEKSGASKKEVDLKKVQIATSMERVGGAQAELAMFDKAEKNYLDALSIQADRALSRVPRAIVVSTCLCAERGSSSAAPC